MKWIGKKHYNVKTLYFFWEGLDMFNLLRFEVLNSGGICSITSCSLLKFKIFIQSKLF